MYNEHTVPFVCVGCKKWIGQVLLLALNVGYRVAFLTATIQRVTKYTHTQTHKQQQMYGMLIQMAHEIII